MRILMLVFNVVERGTYFRAYEFARELVKIGHKVTLIATSPDRYLTHKSRNQDGIRVIETPDWCCGSVRSGWDLYNAFYRMALLKSKEFDIVHSFETRPVNLLPALKLRMAGVPLIFDWADWFGRGGSVEERPKALIRFLLRPVESFFEEKFRKKASATTVICSTLKERAIKLGVIPQSITVIPNGYNIPTWQNTEKPEARKKLGLNEKEFLIGYVGSLFSKDACLMAEVLDLVIAKIPNTRLIHIGHSKYSILKMVKSQDRVIEIKDVKLNEMAQYLSACDICWLPLNNSNANRGRFPMKFSNYLAAGKPIVATDVGDVAEIMAKFNIGIVTNNNAIEICESVCKLLLDQALINKMGDASFSLSHKIKESWAARASQINKIYYAISGILQ